MIPERISAWCREYGVPEDRLSFEYADLGLTCAGRTLFWPSPILRASITVHEAIRGSVCEEEVMWHEYCHWEEGWRYGHMSDHGETWKELYGRRSYPCYLRIVEVFLLILYRFKHRNHLIGKP